MKTLNTKTYNDILKISGYREREILKNHIAIKNIPTVGNHKVIQIIDNIGNSFEYDYKTNKIVG